MALLYDIGTDQYRAATQADVDSLVTCSQAAGLMVGYLRASGRARDSAVADIAVQAMQGKLELSDAGHRLAALLRSGFADG